MRKLVDPLINDMIYLEIKDKAQCLEFYEKLRSKLFKKPVYNQR